MTTKIPEHDLLKLQQVYQHQTDNNYWTKTRRYEDLQKMLELNIKLKGRQKQRALECEYAQNEEELKKYIASHENNKKWGNIKKDLDKVQNVEDAVISQEDFDHLFARQLKGSDPKLKLAAAIEANQQYPTCFYKFVLGSNDDDTEFLQIVMDVGKSAIVENHKLRLFLAVCGLYKGNPLKVDRDLFQPMLQYLATQPNVVSEQAAGYIELCFKNFIAIDVATSFVTITKFDKKFINNFDQFFKRVQPKHNYAKILFKALPHTCLVLSDPMLQALQDEKAFEGIDAGILQSLMVVLVYSFPTNRDLFNILLKAIKETTIRDYEQIEATQLKKFFDIMAKKLQEFKPQWFRKQQAVHELVLGVLTVINLNKVKLFTDKLCNDLLDGTTTIADELTKEIQLSQGTGNEEFEIMLDEIKQCNTARTFQVIKNILIAEPNSKDMALFQDAGISLLLLQQMFLKLSNNFNQCFLCTGAGTGKTTFLCGLAIAKTISTKEPIFFVNSSNYLLYRDFNRVQKWAKMSTLAKKLQIERYCLSETLGAITFLSSEELMNIALPPKFHLIFEEFQEMIRVNTKKKDDLSTNQIVVLASILEMAQSFMGVTGSMMSDASRKVLQTILPNAECVAFKDPYKHNAIEKESIVVSTLGQQINELNKIIKKERNKGPILFILPKKLYEEYKKKDSGRNWVNFLDMSQVEQFDNALREEFTKKINGQYSSFAVLEEGGVGVEYPSNQEIEDQGGVRVCICIKPKNYSDLVQNKRRTARIGRKGVIYYVFKDKAKAGDKQYIQSKEKLLQAKEESTMIRLTSAMGKVLKRPKEENEEIESYLSSNEEMDEEEIKECGKEKSEVNDLNKEETIQINTSVNKDIQMSDNEEVQYIKCQDCELTYHYGSLHNCPTSSICKKGCGKPIHIGSCSTFAKTAILNSIDISQKSQLLSQQEQQDYEGKKDEEVLQNQFQQQFNIQNKGANILKRRQQFDNPVELAEYQNQQVKKLRSSATPGAFTLATTATTINFSSMKAFKGKKQQAIATNSFGFQNKESKEDNFFAHSELQDEQVQPLKIQKSTQEEELSSLPVKTPKGKIKKRNQKEIEKNEVIGKRNLRQRK